MDKTVTLVKLLMTREDAPYPVYALPAGYSFRMYHDGMERHWARIESSVGEFPNEDSALAYFEREFLIDRESLYRRMIFVCDGSGTPVGTITAWYGDLFGDRRGKLHWFAVTPSEQNKGLGRPLLTKCMQIFDEQEAGTRAYLGLQTWSYRAARLYLQFGFTPYFGSCPEGWVYATEDFERNNHLGWMIVHGKILEMQIRKTEKQLSP